MTTTVNLKKMLHRKQQEFCTPNAGAPPAAGAFIAGDKTDILAMNDNHANTYFVAGVSAIWKYNADEDAWQQLPNSGAAGTFAAGACGEARPIGAPGGVLNQTALAGGTTTTIKTSLTITRDLAGYPVHIVAGTGIGYVGTIVSNTVGANAILTVSGTISGATDATTVYRMYTGSFWFFNAGTTAVGFSVYDRATNVWTARAVANLPTAWGTDACLLSTGGLGSNGGSGFATGTATAGGASTLTNSGKSWVTNMWANYQVRITAGTGIGQIRTIASNNGTVLTVSTAWTVQPDATSVYRIEGNDDVMYLLGNNAVTLYKFTISTNTWSTITPGSARAGAPGAGMTANWIDGCADTNWTGELAPSFNVAGTLQKQNGRYIYSFRAGTANTLDIYDIALNTWINAHPYGNQMEVFGAGSANVDKDGLIFIQKDATGRIYKFDVGQNIMIPFAYNLVPQGTAALGNKMFVQTFIDGATKIPYLYSLGNTRAELSRWLVF